MFCMIYMYVFNKNKPVDSYVFYSFPIFSSLMLNFTGYFTRGLFQNVLSLLLLINTLDDESLYFFIFFVHIA